MKKINRIIVLVDFSKNSENLLEFAFRHAQIIGAEMIFVHQLLVAAPAMTDQQTRDELTKFEMQEAELKMAALIKGRIYDPRSFHISNSPILAILETIKSPVFFDWVVVGLKGTNVLKRLFIGSTTLEIVEKSNFLTIAVPIQNPIPAPNKLMVGVNQKFPLNKAQFSPMLASLENQIHEVEFFSILKEDEDEVYTRDYLEELSLEYKSYNSRTMLYQGNDALEALKNHVVKDTFLVLQQGSRTLEDQLFRKFMINELVYNGQIPLIVISS
jgi:nucleotide-binding universal stress UspA family protein